MTLKEFLDANTTSDALVTLTNEGETSSFATVSAGSSSALSAEVQGKEVKSYTVTGPKIISAVLASGV